MLHKYYPSLPGIAQVHRNFENLLERRFSSQHQIEAKEKILTAFPDVQAKLPAEAKAAVQQLPRLELTAGSCNHVTRQISRASFFVQRMEQL